MSITAPGRPSVSHVLALLLTILVAALLLMGIRFAIAHADPQPPRPGATTQSIVATGDSIFHGKLANGLCATCHGANAKGMPKMGPDLTDGVWLHGDGSSAFLTRIITSGVMKPKQSTTVMPPFGGTPLNPSQLRAVVAYLESLR